MWSPEAPWEDDYGTGPRDEQTSWQGTRATGRWDDPRSVAGYGDRRPGDWAPGDWSGDQDYDGGYVPEPAPGYFHPRPDALAAYDRGYGPPATGQVWDDGEVDDPGDYYDDGGDNTRFGRRASGPWPELVMITAVAVIIAAVILAITTADGAKRVNTPPSVSVPTSLGAPSGTTKPGPGSSSTPSTSSTVPRSTTTAPTTTNPAAEPATNLTVTTGVKGSLIKSWLATNPGGVGLGPSDVGGTVPGQVYYADQPATGTYWALVAFEPSATLSKEAATAAGQAKLAQFQNSVYVFSWRSGPYWTFLGVRDTGSCPGAWVPTTVLKVWGLCGL